MKIMCSILVLVAFTTCGCSLLTVDDSSNQISSPEITDIPMSIQRSDEDLQENANLPDTVTPSELYEILLADNPAWERALQVSVRELSRECAKKAGMNSSHFESTFDDKTGVTTYECYNSNTGELLMEGTIISTETEFIDSAEQEEEELLDE